MVACMHSYVFVSVKLRSSCEALYRNIAAFGIQESQTIYLTPLLLCFLYYLSLSSAYEVIEHVPLSFALTRLCFQCPSMHQRQPPSPQAFDLWILSWSVITASRREHWCQICHEENCLMSTNIMNILLTTCGQQHLRFRWYIRRWYIKMLHEILGYFNLLADNFSSWDPSWKSDSKYFCGCHNLPCFALNLVLDPHMIL